ncbi:alpha-2-macroglobulin family protein [Frigidibacter oleivorans]|uniref:alpha-2-macroglobulin family protein n=1 Tax=Frigidibacter oleivorans TaxID=2487129 RepID=UPI000F8E1A9A|nr:alpha-2-macroglobulin family protein [Frigidibacter oleivorans]
MLNRIAAILIASLTLGAGAPLLAQEGGLVPDRRAVLTEGTDFYGSDLRPIFDTTLQACRAACLADTACAAFTFNSRAGSCFPKTGVTEEVPYEGAISGRVVDAAAGAADLARQRAGELGFLQQADFDMALVQARGLSDLHRAADAPVEDYLAAAARDRAADPATAQDWMGRALSVTDAPEHWVDYAELGLARPGEDYERRQYAETALSAAVNAYLRAGSAPMQATALATMAAALERVDRGRATIPALRLAQALDPRDDTAAALADAVGTYGFRIDSHEVRADSARPQICAIFTEDLAQAGVDYATYLRLPDPGLAVEATDRQICVTGVSHGARYEITFRAGLPSAAGEELARDVAVTGYVRDRTPAARFPGRAYILPRAAGAGIPVETVNTDRLELRLSRLSDRNLVRAIQGDFFGRPLEVYEIERLDDAMAETLWEGEAEVAMEVNRDVTTRLPLDAVLADAAGAGPGIYVLTAAVPGQDPWDHPPALQWFLVSDIGITTLQGGDGLHALIRSLADAGPKPGARVQLISRANAVLGEAVADGEGHARFPAAMTAGTGGAAPALLTVSAGEGEAADFAFLPLTEPEFDLSDRGVEGREPAPPIDLFLTTDRGAYRAGEAVHVTALARDPRVAALTDLPLTLRLIRPDGVEHARQLVADAGAGGHVAAFPLAGNVPRGTWRVEALADPDAPPLAGQSILVEDFLPERIDFDLTLPDGPLALDRRPEVGISARYLFGAPGADLAVEGDLRLSAADSLPGWDGYRFGAHDAGLSPQFQTLEAGGRTDAEGRATLPVIFPDMGGAAQPLSAAIAVRLVEGSGRPVERRLDRVVMPQGPVPGLRPLFEGGLPEGAEAGFEVIALGPDARPVPATVSWRVNRVETDWQWYVLYGEWQWEPVTTRTPVAGGEAVLTGDGPVTIAVPTDWGEYEIMAEIAGPVPATASLPFSAGWFAPSAGSDTPDRLDVALDRPAYAPGDTATLRLVAQSAGIAQVSVLSDRVIETRMVEVAEGATELPLTVTDDWGAGAYVMASLLRPLEGAGPDDRAPVRAMGLAHAAVAPGDRQLRAAFEVPEAADPRGPLPVALKVEGVAPGETAFATIAAVDLGILNLTGFDSPDPSAHYFGQRKLGVAVRDSYGRLIDGQTGEMGLVRSGGDAGAGLRMQAPPPTEDLVAFFEGPVQVGADGYARASFDLPSFNGTVRLMAVVWSPAGVGQAEADVLVRDPVVVTAALPRFLTPGDSSRLRLDFVHATGPAGDMALEVAGEGLDLSAPATVTLAEGGTATLSLPLTAPDATGLHRIRVTLTTPDGRRLDKLLSLPVQVNDPEVMRQSRFTLAAGETFTFDANVFAGLIPGTGRATLAAGPVARFDAPGLLSMLDTYPYGCTEQITSRALPLLYLSGLAQDLGVAAEDGIAGRIDEAIAAVLLNQTAGGAFGLWSPESGDLWLDAFVTDFLSRARAEGHDVPDTAFRAALDNLRNQINYAPDFDAGGGPYAYALMVLAREGAAAIGDLRYYADVRAAAFDTPLAAAQLGAALAAYGDQTRADAMFARAAGLAEAPLADEPQVWRADYGTRLRDAGAVLALAAEAGSGAVPQAALADRLAQGIAGRNLSTQEATWALLATHALIDRAGVSGLTVNGAPAEGPLVRLLEDRVAGGDTLAIANGSGAETDLTLTTFGVPSEPEPAQGNGYAITRSYYDLDGNPADPSAAAQGDRLVVVLEVQPFAGGAARLMVDDALPAGFEIDNPNLIRAGDIAAFPWIEPVETRMTEFRQDRFLAALDWEGSETFRLAYVVRAVSPGAFHHPAAVVVDMYRPDYRARTAAGRVTIAE